jgi:hypothetical protein
MTDVLVVATLLGLLGTCVAYVHGCSRIIDHGTDVPDERGR